MSAGEDEGRRLSVVTGGSSGMAVAAIIDYVFGGSPLFPVAAAVVPSVVAAFSASVWPVLYRSISTRLVRRRLLAAIDRELQRVELPARRRRQLEERKRKVAELSTDRLYADLLRRHERNASRNELQVLKPSEGPSGG